MAKVRFTGKSLTGEQAAFLQQFTNAVLAAGGTDVDVLSAFRSPAYNAAVGGVPNSNHTRGDAIDARVLLPDGWTAAGDLSTLGQFGLRSGDQSGFFNGGPDPNHVDTGYPGAASPAPSGLPGDLSSVIQNAASRYGVSPSVLAGIWRIETGSKYPNPYVNSSGYGGLFGTSNWNAPEQSQANTAASILSHLIQTKGNLPNALLAYSGGGYSSVPGMGSSPIPTGTTPATSKPAASPASQNPNLALAAALLSSQPPVQPVDLPSWANVPPPAPSLLPLLLASK